MQTMESVLADLVCRGLITRELALQRASTPDEVVRQLECGGAAA